jgi:hypothetical protein
MSNFRTAALLALVSLFTAACSQEQVGCEALGDLEFVCGPTNAEDLVLAPGTDYIVSSGMSAGKGFYLVDTKNGDWSALEFDARHDTANFANCPAPPEVAELETHGLGIRAVSDDMAMLYVVGHGGREAIEVFEVDTGGSRPELTWVGCVPMPEGLAANSVASTADGSILATVLFMPGKTFADAVVNKQPTGGIYKWSPGEDGFTLLAGSELPANNGIEVSPDGSAIFVASSGYQTIVKFSNTNPVRLLGATRQLPITPDNVHMGPNGMLLTAGMKNDVPECGGPPGPGHDIATLSVCPRGTIAIEIDPATMEERILVETPALDVFSNATMVLTKDGQYWVGTFSGDRILHGEIP